MSCILIYDIIIVYGNGRHAVQIMVNRPVPDFRKVVVNKENKWNLRDFISKYLQEYFPLSEEMTNENKTVYIAGEIEARENTVVTSSLYGFTCVKDRRLRHRRFIPIHKPYENLRPQKSCVRITLHAVSGCATTNSLYHMGKKKAYAAFSKLYDHKHILTERWYCELMI